MSEAKKSCSFQFRLTPLIALALTWSFLVRDLGLFSHWPLLLKNAILALCIAASAGLYAEIGWRIRWTNRQLGIFFGLTALLTAINAPALMQALACDELYHLSMASQTVHFIEKMARSIQSPFLSAFFRNRPMPELVALVNFNLLMVLAAGFLFCKWALNKVKSPNLQAKFIFGGTFFFVFCVGQLFSTFPARLEISPPLRTLPLFIFQALFGFDDFVFRMTSLLATAFVGTCGVHYATQARKKKGGAEEAWSLIVSVAVVLFVPTVLHNSSIVQPSVWAYCSWVGVFLLLSRYFQHRDPRSVIAAGVLLSIGCLMRQNAVVLWPVLGVCLFIARADSKTWALTLLPVLWFLPYVRLLFDGFHHHPVTDSFPIKNVVDSVVHGGGVAALVRGTTPPWILFAVLSAAVALRKKIWRSELAVLTLLGLVPAYGLYFSIKPHLWPAGRYQGEWLGAAIAILGLVLAAHLEKKWLKPFAALSLLLSLYSVTTVRQLHQDAYYGGWPERRISTESVFPYREAFRHLQQQEASGLFTFTGGVPTYGEWHLYLRGFSFARVEEHRNLQKQWEKWFQQPVTWPVIKQAMSAVGIRYSVVQYGNRREQQHRLAWQNRAESLMREAAAQPKSGLILRDRFYGDLEGSIDIFELVEAK